MWIVAALYKLDKQADLYVDPVPTTAPSCTRLAHAKIQSRPTAFDGPCRSIPAGELTYGGPVDEKACDKHRSLSLVPKPPRLGELATELRVMTLEFGASRLSPRLRTLPTLSGSSGNSQRTWGDVAFQPFNLELGPTSNGCIRFRFVILYC